jgi:hypothetical protein
MAAKGKSIRDMTIDEIRAEARVASAASAAHVEHIRARIDCEPLGCAVRRENRKRNSFLAAGR